MKGYYFITDPSLSRAGNLHDVSCAEAAGVSVVQYREKKASSRAMFEEALALRQICKQALFLVNDRVDIARGVNADGVHIGQDDLPYAAARELLGSGKIIGVTVHTVEEAVAAQKMGADYVGVSPIFATRTKDDAGAPAGLSLIREVKRIVPIPVIAIGGINLSNGSQVVDAGADGLCAISAVVTASQVTQEILAFQGLFRRR